MLVKGNLSFNLWIGTGMKFKTLALISTMLMYFDVTAAEQLTVYRWIDKDNVVHFSQHQPKDGDYIEISMANNQKSTAVIEQENTTSPRQDPTLAKSAVEETGTSEGDNDKCNSARDNLNTLQNFDKIQYKDEKGNMKVLGAIEKEQQLAMNKKQVEVFCIDD